jgi:hypothetical protein
MKQATILSGDAKGRFALATFLPKGAGVVVQPMEDGTLVLTPVRKTEAPRLKLVRRAGKPSVFTGGRKVSSDDVRRLLEDQS